MDKDGVPGPASPETSRGQQDQARLVTYWPRPTLSIRPRLQRSYVVTWTSILRSLDRPVARRSAQTSTGRIGTPRRRRTVSIATVPSRWSMSVPCSAWGCCPIRRAPHVRVRWRGRRITRRSSVTTRNRGDRNTSIQQAPLQTDRQSNFRLGLGSLVRRGGQPGSGSCSVPKLKTRQGVGADRAVSGVPWRARHQGVHVVGQLVWSWGMWMPASRSRVSTKAARRSPAVPCSAPKSRTTW